MKTIYINRCGDCPYILPSDFEKGELEYDTCMLTDRFGMEAIIKDEQNIPKWCPIRKEPIKISIKEKEMINIKSLAKAVEIIDSLPPECPSCASKSGSPTLCQMCLSVRELRTLLGLKDPCVYSGRYNEYGQWIKHKDDEDERD